MSTRKNDPVEVGEDWVLAPAAGRIAVELIGDVEKVGSIIIPETARAERPTFGRVVAHGGSYILDDEEYQPLYAIGSYVIFGKYTGVEVRVGRSTKVVIMSEKDVLAQLIPPDQEQGPPPKVHIG